MLLSSLGADPEVGHVFLRAIGEHAGYMMTTDRPPCPGQGGPGAAGQTLLGAVLYFDSEGQNPMAH